MMSDAQLTDASAVWGEFFKHFEAEQRRRQELWDEQARAWRALKPFPELKRIETALAMPDTHTTGSNDTEQKGAVCEQV